ncbi:hypothetical protein [Murimonas intestini]|uniref:Uncharacterized protein n=1 Tax=Murimonas intestini TaxID=1337051 RepID=A0AB73T8Q1_9FIRM|nr:hypothetical protein [Murimonas intestini]MCR1839473.1 hypothetical protein [Murimonas intestini]MCR1864768.1 hypothetical protein [Murimonas intestini]MCR1882378.1 hypothetical protein [Murimonas intestini]
MTLAELMELYKKIEVSGKDETIDTSIEITITTELMNKSVGFYLDNSNNFGHQSSTVHLMCRMVDLMEEKKLRFKKIVVICRMTREEDKKITAQKLQLLLSGFDAEKINEPFTYKNYSILFVFKWDREKLEDLDAKYHVDFALTGGMDITDPGNLADVFGTDYFLRLQPYGWEQPEELYEKGKEKPIDLKELLGKEILCVKPMEPLDVEGWTFYKELKNSGLDKDALTNMEELFNYRKDKKDIWLWPVYGLKQIGRGYPEQNLINIIFMGLQLQTLAKGSKKIVLVVFDKDIDVEDLENVYKDSNNFIEYIHRLEGVEKGKDKEKLVYAGFGGELQSEDLQRINKKTEEIKKIWQEGSISPVENRILFPKDTNNFKELLNTASAKQVIVLKTGSMPASIFEQCYNLAEIPGIFEGQGTAGIAIHIQKPYIQLVKNVTGPPLNIYPGSDCWEQKNVMEQILSMLDWKFFSDSKEFNQGEYLNGLKEAAGNILGLTEGETPSKLKSEFLVSLERQNSRFDKLELGLAAICDWTEVKKLDKCLEKGKIGDEREKPITMDILYETLKSAAESGSLSFHESLPDMHFTNYLDEMCTEAFQLQVKPEQIKAEGSPYESIAVEGAKGVLLGGIPVAIDLKFIYEEQGTFIKSSIKASLRNKEDVQVAGVPWILFQNPAVLLETYESSREPEGAVLVEDGRGNFEMGICWPPEGSAYWIRSRMDEPVTAFEFFNTICGGVSILDEMPGLIRDIGGFGITGIDMLYDFENSGLRKIKVNLETKNGWTILDSPEFRIVPSVCVCVSEPASVEQRSVSIEITGDITFGSAVLNVYGQYPGFMLQASLKEGTSLKLEDILAAFGIGIELDSALEKLSFLYMPDEATLQLDFNVGVHWTIADFFELSNINFMLLKESEKQKVKMDSFMSLKLSEDEQLDFEVLADYTSERGGNWKFYGSQSSETGTSLIALLDFFLGTTTSEWNLPVLGLEFSLDSATGEWNFTGKTTENWDVPFLSDMEIKASVEAGNKAESTYVKLAAGIIWHKIEMELSFEYNSGSKGGGSFGIVMGALSAAIQYSTEKQEWSAELKFASGTSLGSIIEMIIEWCTGEKRSLEAPWDVLNKLKLPQEASLSYNFTTGEVGLNVPLETELNLGIAIVTGISLSYEAGNSTSDGKAMISIEGEFPWNTGDDASGDTKKLGPWDAAQPGSAPAPDGTGNKYFDLRLLALGQNVQIDGLDEARTISEAMEKLKDISVPVKEELPAIAYREGGSWLFGADFGVLHFDDKDEGTPEGKNGYLLDMQMVFDDPALYGIRFTLAGKAAKVFDGFAAEILYRKVNDTIGVYQGELTLPDKMRHLELGAFALTLPVFYAEIYTNGDFKIDVGFPKDGDFSRSLSLYAVVPPGIPLTGSAGFYFGKLSAATADMVPVTDKGLFQPVLIFGLGIKAGLGKSIDAGILQAGFELTVFGILEGVLAKWNPYPEYAPASESYYFYLSGTVGIDGRLYGSVDLVIIKADVDVSVSLSVQFIFETCRKLMLAVAVSVSVKAGLTLNLGIFKIHIHFSFSMKIREEFTIGKDTRAPWDAGNNIALGKEEKPDYSFCWGQLESLPAEERVHLTAYLAGALSGIRSDDAGTGWQPVYVAMPLIPSMGEADTCREQSVKKALSQTADSDFETLSKMLLRYLIAALLDLGESGKTITWQEMDDRRIEKDMPQFIKDHIDELNDDAIVKFLLGQLSVEFTTAVSDELHGVPFPVPDGLVISDGDISYSFGEFSNVSAAKLDDLKVYFDALAVQVEKEQKKKKRLQDMDGMNGPGESMSHWVFGDYFKLLAKQLGQAMQDIFKDEQCDTFTVREMLAALQAKGDFEQLAGMVSNYQFHGLRIPTEGINITGSAHKVLKPEEGLYALTGQQIELPAKVTEEYFELTFSKREKAGEDWYTVNEKARTIVINPGDKAQTNVLYESGSEIDLTLIRQMQSLNKFAVGITPLKPVSAARIEPAEYNIANPVPFGDGQIYTLPKVLTEMMQEEGKVLPSFEWKTAKSHMEEGIRKTAVQRVHPGLLVKVKVKPLPQPCAYEIYCVEARAPRLLKSLYRQIKESRLMPQLMILYGSDGGYWCDKGDDYTAGIIKSNLSTVTHPVTGMKNASMPEIFGGIEDFVLCLWEAFVTNSGGFYFYYDHESRKGEGLPGEIFSDDGEAVLNIFFSEPCGGLSDCHNVVFVEESIQDGQSFMAAVSPQAVTAHWLETTTIKEICSYYRSCLTNFSEHNGSRRFREKADIRIRHGLYQYVPGSSEAEGPGAGLQDVALWFDTSVEEIDRANLRREKGQPLSAYEVICLPVLRAKAGGKFGCSAEEIGDYCGICAEQVLWDNYEQPGLYDGDTELETGPFIYHPMSFNGAATMQGMRKNATEELKVTNGEDIESFLENNYTMLGYRIYKNADFDQSNQAVPAGPVEEDGFWNYEVSIPYEKYNSRMGSILQVEYEWIDIFGNAGSLEQPSGSRQPLVIGYTDALISPCRWPSVVLGWEVVSGEMRFHISFDATPYEEEGKEEKAEQDCFIYEQVLKQLTDENGITLATETSLLEEGAERITWTQQQCGHLLAWLFTGEDSVLGYIRSKLPEQGGQENVNRPQEFVESFTIDRDMLNRKDAFRLETRFVIERDQKVTGYGLWGAEDILALSEELTVWMDPQAEANAGGRAETGQSIFIRKFEDSFKDCIGFKLKLALESQDAWWCVRIADRPGFGLYLKAEEEEVQIFAPRPVQNRLWNSGESVEMMIYETGKGILPEVRKKAVFEDIDLDVWLEKLFKAVDDMFEADNIIPVRILDEIEGMSKSENSYYKRMTTVKKDLASLGRSFLEGVYKEGQTDGIEEAREAFYQRLLTKLDNYYTTHAVLAWHISTDALGPVSGENDYLDDIRLSLEAGASSVVSYIPSKAVLRQKGKGILPVCVQAPELVTLEDGTVISSLDDKVSVKGRWMEHGIQNLPDMEDYEDSSWLSLNDIEDTCLVQSLGEVTIPFVLRKFPDLPKLNRQFDGESPSLIKELAKWEYRMEYELPFHFPQDEVSFRVIFNPVKDRLLRAEKEGLAIKLARFQYLYDVIKKDLDEYLPALCTDTKQEEAQNAKAAVESFLLLAGEAASSDTAALRAAYRMPGSEAYVYVLKEGSTALTVDGQVWENVFIAGLFGEKPENLGMPVAYVADEEYEPVALSDSTLADMSVLDVQDMRNGVYYWYRSRLDGSPLAASRAQQIKGRQIGLPCLNILRYQSAVSELELSRNKELVEGKETAAPFVYTTGAVSFSDIFYAAKDIEDEIDITNLEAWNSDIETGEKGKDSIASFMKGFLNILMDGDPGQKVTLQAECVYMRKMRGSTEEIQLPVFMQPCMSFEGKEDGEETLLRQMVIWEKEIDEWCISHLNYDKLDGPWNDENKISLDLTVFSDQTEQPVPLIRLRRLIIPGSRIAYNYSISSVL